MAMSATKVRGFIAAVVAILCLVFGGAFATSVLGWTIPGLSHIAEALNFPGPGE